METFIILSLFGGIFFLLGWKMRERHALREIDKLVDKMNDDMVDEFKKKVIDITVEKSGDFFFVYRKEDGAFLAQGTDINKLSDILTEKFPGKLFNCSKEDLARLEATQ